MKLTLLYIRGEPGTGKKTVADILKKELGWSLFWIHDLECICKIIEDKYSSYLLDQVTIPIIKHLFRQHKNVIFVRPSRSYETVDKVYQAVCKLEEETGLIVLPVVVRLAAKYDVLLHRVGQRPPMLNRIANKEELDFYLNDWELEPWPGEHVIQTDDKAPEEIAKIIMGILQKWKLI